MFKKLIICLIVVLLSACKADCFDDKAMTKFEFKSSIKGIKLTSDNWEDFLEYSIVEVAQEDENGNLTGDVDGYIDFTLKDGYIISDDGEIEFDITVVSQDETYDTLTNEKVILEYAGEPNVYENRQTLYLSGFNYQTKNDEYPVRMYGFSTMKLDYVFTDYDINGVEREVYDIWREEIKSIKAAKASGMVYQLDIDEDKMGTKDGKSYFAIYDDGYVSYYYDDGYVEVYDKDGVYLYDNAYLDLYAYATNDSSIFYHCWNLGDIIN